MNKETLNDIIENNDNIKKNFVNIIKAVELLEDTLHNKLIILKENLVITTTMYKETLNNYDIISKNLIPKHNK